MHQTPNLVIVRLALSGAILGIAIMGIVSGLVHPVPNHEVWGALLGSASVLFAKARHYF